MHSYGRYYVLTCRRTHQCHVRITLAIVGASLVDQLLADPTLVELGIGSEPTWVDIIVVRSKLVRKRFENS